LQKVFVWSKIKAYFYYKSDTVLHSKWKDLGNMKGARMFRIKMIVFVSLVLTFTASLVYCQEKVETRHIITIEGIVAKVDAVGSIIEVKTDEKQMAFSVPDGANITEGTKKIGLMDIEPSDPVTVQYYSPSPGKLVVVSITYNKNS